MFKPFHITHLAFNRVIRKRIFSDDKSGICLCGAINTNNAIVIGDVSITESFPGEYWRLFKTYVTCDHCRVMADKYMEEYGVNHD